MSSITEITDLGNPDTAYWTNLLADVDGDGRDDLVYHDGDLFSWNWHVRRSTGSGFGPRVSAGFTTGSTIQHFEYDSDNQADFHVHPRFDDPPCERVYSAERGSLTMIHRATLATEPCLITQAGPLPTWFLDLDGDRLTEAVTVRPPFGTFQTTNFVWIPREGDALSAYEVYTDVRTGYGQRFLTLDVDGDGRTEQVRYVSTGFPSVTVGLTRTRLDAPGVIQTWRLTERPGPFTGPSGSARTLDANGDGLADVMAAFEQSDHLLRVNTGNGFLPLRDGHAPGQTYRSPRSFAPTNPGFGSWDFGDRTTDLNGDGRSDMVFMRTNGFYDDTDHMFALVSTSNGYVARDLPYPSGVYGGARGWSTSRSGDIDGDGHTDFVILVGEYPSWRLQIVRRRSSPQDLVRRVVDGLGGWSEVRYRPMSDRSVYTPDSSCQYPQRCMVRGRWLAHRLTHPGADTSGSRSWTQRYSDARFDLLGRGMIGMGRTTRTDDTTGATTTTDRDVRTRIDGRYPFANLTVRSAHTVSLSSNGGDDPGFVATDVSTRPEYVEHEAGTYSVRLAGRTELLYEDDLVTPALRIATTYSYDQYNNVTAQRRDWGGGRSDLASTSYVYDTSRWLIRKPEVVLTTSTINSLSDTRISSYQYTPDGYLSRINSHEGFDIALTVDIERDPQHGLPIAVRTRDAFYPERVTRIEYDVNARNPYRVVNAAGHHQWFAYHPSLDVLAQTTDHNGLTTAAQYDGFGRPVTTRAPDGSGIAGIERRERAGGGYQMVVIRRGGGREEVDVDAQGRQACEAGQDALGNLTRRCYAYDDLSRVRTVTRPFRGSTGAVNQTISYDNASRITRIEREDGSATRLEYDHRITRRFDPANQRVDILTDTNGLVTEIREHTLLSAVISTSYEHRGFAQLRSVSVDGRMDTTISFAYDNRGNRTDVFDPDAGHRRWTYDGYGRVRTEVDPRGVATQYTRDALGRPIEVSYPEDGTSLYEWDLGEYGVGSLYHTFASGSGIHRYFRRGTNGRVRAAEWDLGGADRFDFLFNYDQYGRVDRVTYPALPGQTQSQRFSVRNSYANGQLAEVNDPADANREYWLGTQIDIWGAWSGQQFADGLIEQTRSYLPGSGLLDMDNTYVQRAGNRQLQQSLDYDYDVRDLPESVTDSVAGRSEAFQHDSLGRLLRWELTSGGRTRAQGYGYDNLGNLTSVAGDMPGNANYRYDNLGRPHQASWYGPTALGYDELGRRTTGPGYSIRYNRFDLPTRIDLTSQPTAITLEYDADGSLTRRREGSETEVTVGQLYRRRTGGAEGTIHEFDLVGPDGVFARRRISAQGTQLHYLTRNPLGTGTLRVDVDEGSRTVVGLHHRYFNPWGTPIESNGDLWGTPLRDSPVDDGFTGHRHDDGGLLDMGGRWMDLSTRQALTADPLRSVLGSQGWNPYAYARSSPVAFTDPSGFIVTRPDLAREGGSREGNAGQPETSDGDGGGGGEGGPDDDGNGGGDGGGGDGGCTGPDCGCSFPTPDDPGGGVDPSASDGGSDPQPAALPPSPEQDSWHDYIFGVIEGITGLAGLPGLLGIDDSGISPARQLGRLHGSIAGMVLDALSIVGGIGLESGGLVIGVGGGVISLGTGPGAVVLVPSAAGAGASLTITGGALAAAGIGMITIHGTNAAEAWRQVQINQMRGQTGRGGTTTPGGRRITNHGGTRIDERFRSNPSLIDEIIDGATQTTTQADGADVFIRRQGRGGAARFDVVVVGEQGIVTAIGGLRRDDLRMLARNYGWEGAW